VVLARSTLLFPGFFEARPAELRQRQWTALGEHPAAAMAADIFLLRHG